MQNGGICRVEFNLNETLKGPLFVYYELNNFYLNHRNLVKSKIFTQLQGKTHVDSSNNSKCEGAVYMWEMFDNDTSKYFTYTGVPLNGTSFANPCGLVAKCMFNGIPIL